MRSSTVDKMNNPDVTTAAPACSRADEELVAAAQSGDELALEMLIKRHQQRVFAIALRYVRVREDAEDIVQQTFQKVFVYLRKFQGKSSFSTWLTRIAINESLMFLRRGRALREVSVSDACSEAAFSRDPEVADSGPNPEMSCLEQEAAQILFSAMTKLTPGVRVALELTELRELSSLDAARRMGVSIAAVKARVFHGRRKLRELVRHHSIRRSRRCGSTLAVTGNVQSLSQCRSASG